MTVAAVMFALGLLATTRAEEWVADGKFDREKEWAGAQVLEAGRGVTVLLKQGDGMVAIGVVTGCEFPAYVDLFVETRDGVIWNLHASMQQGERTVAGRGWDDRNPATRWGRQKDWKVNTRRPLKERANDDPLTKASFPPAEGYEFVIERAKLDGGAKRLRVEVRDFTGKAADIVFPAGSSRFEPGGWWELRFE